MSIGDSEIIINGENILVNLLDPIIILNKVNYDDVHIPNYYGFSKNHSSKLKNYIGGYYEKLKTFYGNPTLLNVLTTVQKSSRNLIRIANVTPKFSCIKMGEEKIGNIEATSDGLPRGLGLGFRL